MRQMPSIPGAVAAAAPQAWGIGGVVGWVLSLILLPIGLVWALDSIPISHAPPYLLRGVPPNLVLTLDDSGSMRQRQLGEVTLARRFDASDTASLINRQYYDPALVYLPPCGRTGPAIRARSFLRRAP